MTTWQKSVFRLSVTHKKTRNKVWKTWCAWKKVKRHLKWWTCDAISADHTLPKLINHTNIFDTHIPTNGTFFESIIKGGSIGKECWDAMQMKWLTSNQNRRTYLLIRWDGDGEHLDAMQPGFICSLLHTSAWLLVASNGMAVSHHHDVLVLVVVRTSGESTRG